MSGYTEEVECPRCGGVLHVSTDRKDPEGNYDYCLDCGQGHCVSECQWTLEELNEERKEWEMEPLDRLPYDRIAMIKTDLRNYDTLGVLIFKGITEMARCIADEYKLTPVELKQIEDTGGAVVIPNEDGGYRLHDDGDVDEMLEYPQGTIGFESVAILNE